jgi:polar amino acid transport system substrate-binding protein
MKKLIILFLIIFSYANEKVNIQLDWKYQFEFAGFIMAKEKGFYKKEGLDVNLEELSQNTNVEDKILNSPATYGVGDNSLVYDIMKGKRLELLMPIYNNLYVLASLNNSVKSLKYLLNKQIVLDQFAKHNIGILGMLSTVGCIKDFKFKQNNYFNLKKEAVLDIYISNLLYNIKKQHIPYKLFNPSDYGFDFYSDILFTSQNEFKNHKARVLKVMNATKKGYIYAFTHIDETIKIIKEKYNTQNFSKEKLRYEAKVLQTKLVDDFLFDDNKIKQIVVLYNSLFKLGYHKSIFDYIYSPYRLTKDEKKFIDTHILKVITTTSWAPFNTIRDGKVSGIALDYWKYIKDELHLKSELIPTTKWNQVLELIKTKKADLTLSTTNTPDREKYAVFTKPYTSFPIVIATRNDVGFIADIKSLYGKKIAVGKKYTSEKFLNKYYPNLELIETKNTSEALKLVSEGKAFAVVDILPVLAYNISKYSFANVKISGRTPFNFDLKIMIRKDYKALVPLINRIIDNMPESKKEEIYNKWIAVNIQEGYSKDKINQFIIIGLGFLFLIVGWGIYAYINIQKRKKLGKELLELSIKDGLTKIYNRRKIDEILDKEIKIAKRYNESLSLIFFDVDTAQLWNCF